MTPETQLLTLETPAPSPEPATCNLQPATPLSHQSQPIVAQPSTPPRRPKGKIPSLPKAQRDTINYLLLDGATYKVVEIELAKLGVSLNAENISNWYQTGFQDYLAQLDRLDYQRARYEAATDLLQDTDTAKLPEASLQSAAAQVFDLLGRFTPAALAQNIADDPDKYTRLLNSLSRLTREALAFQTYRDACAKARAALKPMLDPKRKLTQEERRHLVLQVDEILGLPPQPDGPGRDELRESNSNETISGPHGTQSSEATVSSDSPLSDKPDHTPEPLPDNTTSAAA
jgi:hypothetical protein